MLYCLPRERVNVPMLLLYLVERPNQAPILAPIRVVSRDPDAAGLLHLAEPLQVAPGEDLLAVPASRCYEYDPYLAHAVEAYAAQVATLLRVARSVIEGLAMPITEGQSRQSDSRTLH